MLTRGKKSKSNMNGDIKQSFGPLYVWGHWIETNLD